MISAGMKKDKSKNSDQEDLRLIQKVKKGNIRAFEKIVLKYQKQLYVLVRKMVLNHDDTNDIVQDTFVKVFSNLKTFDEQKVFYPWLHRILINTTLNQIEKKRRYQETYIQAGNQDEYFSPNGNPLKAVIQSEYENRIALALGKLSDEQRIVFILKTSEELSYQEISEQLNISLGTVMSRLSRAREKLKKLLSPYWELKNKQD